MLTHTVKLGAGNLFGVVVSIFLIFALTLSVLAQSAVELEIFIEPESITILIAGNQTASLSSIGFEVVIVDNREIILLEDFANFAILRVSQVPLPICLRIERFESNTPLPNDCQSITTLTQSVTPADTFWYDPQARQTRSVILVQGLSPLSLCPTGQVMCSATFIPPSPAPTPTLDVSASPQATNREVTYFTVTANDQWTPVEREINGINMVLVPPGSFLMGLNGEGGQQTFTEPFWIGRTEVTNAQYKVCVDAGVCTVSSEGYQFFMDTAYADHPIAFVEWTQGVVFANWWGGRLPNEAEWEYAMRGPDGLRNPWGNQDNDCENANNIFHCAGNRTKPVGSYLNGVSWVGGFDFSGNLGEWTNSRNWSYPYDRNDGREEPDPNGSIVRIVRGNYYGTWITSTSMLRIPLMGNFINGINIEHLVGFRVACDFGCALMTP